MKHFTVQLLEEAITLCAENLATTVLAESDRSDLVGVVFFDAEEGAICRVATRSEFAEHSLDEDATATILSYPPCIDWLPIFACGDISGEGDIDAILVTRLYLWRVDTERSAGNA